MADFPISPVVRRVVYTGSAGVGPYAFTFEILAQTDIDVYVDSTLKTLTTDYTVIINANGTGSVTFVAAPGTTKRITIVGARDITRASDYVTGGDFTASSLNLELDQQTIFNQQNAEALGRALIAPVTDPSNINMILPVQTSRAGKTLAFDSNGNPVVGEDIGNYRGDWVVGLALVVRDLVKDTTTQNIFRVNTAHTSSGALPLTTNADSAKFDLVVDAAAAGASATAAAASASAAASSASAASTSASNASTSATNASNSATAASTSASNASTSATNASNSATSASGSASTATSQATAATTSATNAATSASAASGSASTASTQASNASTSASAASTSATNASNSATAASTSASNASTSATSASGSASTATTQATNAASSATASANSATSAASSAASAAALLDNFDDRYLGAKTSDPALDNDGNALILGALYFNTTDGVMKVYTASGWIAASSASVATLATFEFVATAGQTVFSGNDANGVSLSYVAPAIIVTLNGVRLRPGDDYTATNGTSITLISAAALNDELVVDAFGSFLVANTYTIAEVDAFAVKLTGNQSITGTKTFSNDLTIGTAAASTNVQTALNGVAGKAKRIRFQDSGTDQWLVGMGAASETSAYEIFNANGEIAQSIAKSDNQRSSQIPGSSGLKPAFDCRAWVNFNGSGTVAIRSSGNVSSITDRDVGKYTVNFTTAMPDANYAAVAWDNNYGTGWYDTLSTGSLPINRANNLFNFTDTTVISVAIFR